MKIVICGTVIPKEYELRIKQLSNAANRFLLNIIEAFERLKQDISIVSYVGVDTNEEVKRLLDKDTSAEYVFKTNNKIDGIKQLSAALKKQCVEADWVIAYNTVYAWLDLPFIAKRNKTRSALILADFSPPKSYKSIARKIYASMQIWSMRKYDLVIGLSENVEKYLRKKQGFICIEGGINTEVYNSFNEYKNCNDDKYVCMYAGTLEPVTGIDILIDALELIKDGSVELWISGKGSLALEIEEKAKTDNRIKYLGCIEYDEYLKKLQTADVLINPRNMSLPENLNNFPSKIMEYLATGKRIVSTKFPGWEKFSEVITFCDSNSNNLAASIMMSRKDKETKEEWETRRAFAKEYLWDERVEEVLKKMR